MRLSSARKMFTVCARLVFSLRPKPAPTYYAAPKSHSIADESLGPAVIIVKWRKILKEESEGRVVLVFLEKRTLLKRDQ